LKENTWMPTKRPTDLGNLIKAINRCWLSVKYAGRKVLAKYELDLTMEQLMVLFTLRDRDGQNLRDLAEKADREKTTMTRMIDGLEKRNLVLRVPDRSDGRLKLVYRTKKGRQITENLEKHAIEFEETAQIDLTEKQINDTVKVLLKITANLGYDQ